MHCCVTFMANLSTIMHSILWGPAVDPYEAASCHCAIPGMINSQ